VTPTARKTHSRDVSTLHFETDTGDGFREPGFSKERRLDPQIALGLLTDASGFPLSVVAFEGNKAETGPEQRARQHQQPRCALTWPAVCATRGGGMRPDLRATNRNSSSPLLMSGAGRPRSFFDAPRRADGLHPTSCPVGGHDTISSSENARWSCHGYATPRNDPSRVLLDS
jgi:hypothetical protein